MARRFRYCWIKYDDWNNIRIFSCANLSIMYVQMYGSKATMYQVHAIYCIDRIHLHYNGTISTGQPAYSATATILRRKIQQYSSTDRNAQI